MDCSSENEMKKKVSREYVYISVKYFFKLCRNLNSFVSHAIYIQHQTKGLVDMLYSWTIPVGLFLAVQFFLKKA